MMQMRIQGEEYVALATFGHECKVQQRLTNDFSKLRQIFGKMFSFKYGCLLCPYLCEKL